MTGSQNVTAAPDPVSPTGRGRQLASHSAGELPGEAADAADWPGFIVRFMHNVFTEPDPSDVIAEMIAIGLETTPEVAVTQELELDWRGPARLLGTVTCPTLVVHGEADAPVPASLAQNIVAAMPNARLELIPDGGHRPDIRTPELVNPVLLEFLLDP